jgi:hypothetical protein
MPSGKHDASTCSKTISANPTSGSCHLGRNDPLRWPVLLVTWGVDEHHFSQTAEIEGRAYRSTWFVRRSRSSSALPASVRWPRGAPLRDCEQKTVLRQRQHPQGFDDRSPRELEPGFPRQAAPARGFSAPPKFGGVGVGAASRAWCGGLGCRTLETRPVERIRSRASAPSGRVLESCS